MFNFTYYADTFICQPSPSPDGPSAPKVWKFKQVLTRGFPTYRAQAKLISDLDTGKVYLYGGYTNTEFVPDKKNCIARPFGDLWQLKLDDPNGFFEGDSSLLDILHSQTVLKIVSPGVDMDEEAKTAKNGPWRRCKSTPSWRRCL